MATTSVSGMSCRISRADVPHAQRQGTCQTTIPSLFKIGFQQAAAVPQHKVFKRIEERIAHLDDGIRWRMPLSDSPRSRCLSAR